MTSTPPDFSDETLRDESENLAGDPGTHPDPEHDVPGPDVPGPDEEAGDPEAPAPERVRTGSDRVDEVIRAVEELEDRPIEEHVGVFESAQVQLRRALDDPGDDDQVGGAEHADDHPGHA
ncbi:hypothetical protein [Nocardioides halotolerans]|jgi:hypothetical protein|uniref:hypothetical protein n=1 Tax=Nocardioides halotolerans TaxID=433660 RepID=UPI00041FB6C6|nr:hypothetical protein [Nocardioides halotolerans]